MPLGQTQWRYKGQLIKELYDLHQDPWETVNLADKPQGGLLQGELAALLTAGWKAALPKAP